MNINRHNYESIFTLYVDNELSAAEKNHVELFVRQNPDLKPELELLLQTILSPEDISLDKKDWLLMEEEISPVQEILFMHADNELSDDEESQVKELLATDEKAAAEWEVIKQIKLQPDFSLLYPDKASLYKKQPARLISINWQRAAAAAILLGAGIWIGSTFQKNNLPAAVETVATQNNNTDNNNSTTVLQPEVVKNNAQSTQPEDSNEIETPKQDPSIVTYINNSNSRENSQADKENTAAVKVDPVSPVNNMPNPLLDKFNRKESNETITVNVTQERNNSNNVSGNKNAIINSNPVEVNNALLVNDGGNKTENNNAIAMQAKNNKPVDDKAAVDADTERPTLLGGIFKKAKTALERTTNIRIKDAIRIGNYEISL